ncbi:DNA-binding protein RFXANK-like isoform X2 [Artemia franciscana]|uniref:DNA-binding protein RFXANK-like isoform X2 n=1 Tax=Artemia franciscana TaxID=6661 RepID=UPI0032DBAB98
MSTASSETQPKPALTNLQRGNVKTAPVINEPVEETIHHRAGQGEILEPDLPGIDLNEKDVNGLTPLMWAAAHGQAPTLSLLLAKGADPNIKSDTGETALHYGASSGHHEVVRLLLQTKIDVDPVDEAGNTPLYFAAIGNYTHTVQELLSHGADLVRKNHFGETPYEVAITKGSGLARKVMDNHMLSFFDGSHY